MGSRHRDGQDLALAGSQPGQHEADRRLGALPGFARGITEHSVLLEQGGEFTIGPRANEILAVQQRDRGAVGDLERLERIVPAAWLEERYAH